jgi:predicted membrane protein
MIPEPQTGTRGPALTSQLILGLAVIAVGLLFTLDNLDILDARRYLPFWPVVFIAIGVVSLLNARETPQRLFGGVLTFVGVWMLLGRWGFWQVRLWDLWPVLLIYWGAVIVWRGWYGRSLHESAVPDRASTFSVVAFLSGFDRVVTADDFKGGEVSAFMGGGKIDLTRARISSGNAAVVHVTALMGGMEIRIPDEWTVENRVTYFMGGSNDRSRLPANPAAPRLILKGFVMMGGVEIKN